MIKELITRRRKQILVHSCIYYRFMTNIISDSKFDEWAYELVNLQESHPEIAERDVLIMKILKTLMDQQAMTYLLEGIGL